MRDAIAVVTRLVARMRASACPEAAVAFAAAGDGPAAARLAAAERAARGTGDTGLECWGEACDTPGVARAATLVEAAAEAPRNEQVAALERAREAVLEGARDEAADAAATLRGPATALYAFGVILPLALVAVLPAAEVAGVVASVPLVVLTYDVVLPVALWVAGRRLLAARPAAFPAPQVGRDHPAVPDWPRRAVLAAVTAGGVAALVTGAALPGWTVPFAALGGAAGAGLAVAANPRLHVHRRVEAAERRLPDACSLVGAAVREGTAVERALADAAADVDDETAAVIGEAVARQEQLGIGVEAAFVGPDGALADLPSARFRDAAHLLGLAAVEGRPAGEALDDLGDHLAALARVEREARRELGGITATLANTAAVFAPLVGGATVAMAGAFGEELAVGALGLAVGCYVLILAGGLAALSAGLETGRAPGPVARRAGLSILAATVTYLCTFVAAGALT